MTKKSNLFSLEGAPTSIAGNLSSNNSKLESLEGCPNKIEFAPKVFKKSNLVKSNVWDICIKYNIGNLMTALGYWLMLLTLILNK